MKTVDRFVLRLGPDYRIEGLLLLLLVRLHDQSSSSDEVGGLLQVLQAPL